MGGAAVANEQAIAAELSHQFPFLTEGIKIARERRVFVSTPYSKFLQVFGYAVRSMHFAHLVTITGTDEGEQLGAIYHLARPDGTLLNIKTVVPKAEPWIDSVTGSFPGGVFYEQELVDLLGFKVRGLPPRASRYPLRDDWPEGQYPLRKDWSVEMLDQCSAKKEGA